MKEPLRSIVYRQLRDKIISCEFAPNSFVTEDQLIEIAGTSRTPVREAVQKLEDDRFVRIFPKRGIYVCEMTTRNLREVFEIRSAIEPFAMRQYGFRISREKAEEVLGRIGSGAADIDSEIHQIVSEAAVSVHLEDIIELMYGHSCRLRNGSGLGSADLDGQISEDSIQMLRLLLDGGYDRAASMLQMILEQTEQRIYEAMVGASAER